jgi:hypothetical protein
VRKEEFGDMAEIQQLLPELDERVLERAEADPQWKRRFVEDPDAAMGDMPEAQRVRQMEESAWPTEQPPTEATMITPTEEYRRLQQGLTEKVLDRAASDPLWKQRLLDDPEVALLETDFPEVKRIDEMRQMEEEVGGQIDNPQSLGSSLGAGGTRCFCSSYYKTCYNMTICVRN